VIDVSVAGDEDDVDFVPAAVASLLGRHRQRSLSERTSGPTAAARKSRQKTVGWLGWLWGLVQNG
jgi:hypothetical protein